MWKVRTTEKGFIWMVKPKDFVHVQTQKLEFSYTK